MGSVNIFQRCRILSSMVRKLQPRILVIPVRHFYEKDIRAGRRPQEKISNLKHIKTGFQHLKGELMLWKDEVIEKFRADPKFYAPGETNVIWTFNNKDSLENWIATSDKDNNEGESEVNFTITKNGRGLFTGVLRHKIPKDGNVKRSGYCNIRSVRAVKSFKRDTYLNWQDFTHLALRIRGDGRSYLINVATPGFFDVTWYDVYNYVLYTRGGPYWQVAKIPFSKFFLSHRGRVQDKQARIPLNKVSSVGITCADHITGPFHLEIDYIGVYLDANYKEQFAYEMYKVPTYVVGSG